MNTDIPLLIAPILLSNAGGFDIGEPATVSFAPVSSRTVLTLLFLPLWRVSASGTAVLLSVPVQLLCAFHRCRTRP